MIKQQEVSCWRKRLTLKTSKSKISWIKKERDLWCMICIRKILWELTLIIRLMIVEILKGVIILWVILITLMVLLEIHLKRVSLMLIRMILMIEFQNKSVLLKICMEVEAGQGRTLLFKNRWCSTLICIRKELLKIKIRKLLNNSRKREVLNLSHSMLTWI